MHQPLSQELADVLNESSAPTGITLNKLLEHTGGRGFYLVILVLCLPFVVPVSIPGLSTIMGGIIVLLTLCLASGRAPKLPAFLGERKLPPSVQERVVARSIKFLRFLEKFIRPRRTKWLTVRAARIANVFLIAVLAVLLALPLPAPPFFFSNSIPCYAIILLAASMMEEDGVLIWYGYALVLANVIFFSLIGKAIAELIIHTWHALSHFLLGL